MKNVLIICQYATNKGDRAIAEYLTTKLRSEDDVCITLSTTDPSLWGDLSKNNINVISTGYPSSQNDKKRSLISRIKNELRTRYYNRVVYPKFSNHLRRESQFKV